MEWTTDKPTQEGFYWAYENLDPEDADVMLVNVSDGGGDAWCAWWEGDIYFELTHFSHWMGPLEVPVPPKSI